MARKLGNEVMMDILKEYQVEYVFGIPGATEIHFMEGIEATPEIQYILGLNEMVCVGAAEGYARAKNKPAVLNLHTGPGMAAAMPLLLNCKYGKVPLVITVGQNTTSLLGKDPQLSGDIVGMAKPIAKWATEIHTAEEIPIAMHRAFKMAMQKPMGPVVVSIPYDLMTQELEYEAKPLPKLDYKAGRGSQEMIMYACELLEKAEHPVMFVQEGVARSRALKETVEFAEKIGAAVYQIWMGDVNFPVNHPLYQGDIDSTSPEMKAVLQKADVVVGIGCQMFNDAFPSDIVMPLKENIFIQIDEDPWEIGKNFPVDCGIQGDIKEILAELNLALQSKKDLQEKAALRTEIIKKEKEAETTALNCRIDSEKDNKPIAVSALMNAIKNAVNESVCIVDDSWSSSALLRKIVPLGDETSFYRPRNGGSIGFGLPGALGVKMAYPEKNVILVSGDGSAAWSMQTFWTVAHYNIPVTMIITNNGTYRQVKNVRKRILGDYLLNERHVGMEIDHPRLNFKQMAESMGVEGVQIYEPEEIEAAVKYGMFLDKPYLIEVFVENPAK